MILGTQTVQSSHFEGTGLGTGSHDVNTSPPAGLSLPHLARAPNAVACGGLAEVQHSMILNVRKIPVRTTNESAALKLHYITDLKDSVTLNARGHDYEKWPAPGTCTSRTSINYFSENTLSRPPSPAPAGRGTSSRVREQPPCGRPGSTLRKSTSSL